MASYSDGVWTFASPECPCCIAVRTSQGFPPVTPRQEQTPASVERWAKWEASMPVFDVVEPPVFESMMESMDWYAAHPSAETKWVDANPPPEQEWVDVCGELCESCKPKPVPEPSPEWLAFLADHPTPTMEEVAIFWEENSSTQ